MGVGARPLAATLFYAGVLQLAYGKRSQAEALWRELDELATAHPMQAQPCLCSTVTSSCPPSMVISKLHSFG